MLALVLVGCGGAQKRAAPEVDPAVERAEVQAALSEEIAAATAEYGKFVVEAKISRDEVAPGPGSQVHIACAVTVTVSMRDSGKMIGFSKTSAAVASTADQALLSRKDCVIIAGREGLKHFDNHFATSASAFALAAAQSGIFSGALAFN